MRSERIFCDLDSSDNIDIISNQTATSRQFIPNKTPIIKCKLEVRPTAMINYAETKNPFFSPILKFAYIIYIV